MPPMWNKGASVLAPSSTAARSFARSPPLSLSAANLILSIPAASVSSQYRFEPHWWTSRSSAARAASALKSAGTRSAVASLRGLLRSPRHLTVGGLGARGDRTVPAAFFAVHFRRAGFALPPALPDTVARMVEKRSHLSAALTEQGHALAGLLAAALLAVGVLRGPAWLAFAGVALEIAWVAFATLSPGRRSRRAQEWALDDRDQRRDRLQASMLRLSPNAQSRMRALLALRETALGQLPAGDFRERWHARLDELVEVGLQLLVQLDANPPRAPGDDLGNLRSEVAAAPPGPAREAKAQRLALLQERAARTGSAAQQREAAVVQLDTVQDLFEDLARAPLEGRDPAALSARLTEVLALTGAARDSIAALRS